MNMFETRQTPAWPEPGRLPSTRGYRRRRSKGWPQLQVAIAVYPEDVADLSYLAHFMSQRFSFPIERPDAEDRCIFVVLELIAKDEFRALAQVESYLRRRLPHSVPIKRVLLDTRRVPDQPLSDRYVRGAK